MKTYIKFLLNLFFISFLKIFLVFSALIFITNIFEQIEFFKKLDVHFIFPIFLSFLNSPSIIFEILPFIFLISTQFFFIKLIENNEMQIFKYFGLDNHKIIKIISLFAFIFGIILIIFFYNFSSVLKNYYLGIKNSYTNDDKYLAVITENGLWIKDEINQEINIINASKVDKEFLIDVSIAQFNKNYDYVRMIESSKIDISSYNWQVLNPSVTKNNITEDLDKLELQSNFDLEKINSLFSNLSSLTIIELLNLRKSYKSLNYSLIEIDSHLHKIASYPFYLTLITILSAIMMFNIGFQKNSIFKIILGILLSVVIYYVNYFFNVLGANEKIPLVLSIWFPLIILSIINFFFMVRLNEK
jgi:lipopolysaccharide export system permease protein